MKKTHAQCSVSGTPFRVSCALQREIRSCISPNVVLSLGKPLWDTCTGFGRWKGKWSLRQVETDLSQKVSLETLIYWCCQQLRTDVKRSCQKCWDLPLFPRQTVRENGLLQKLTISWWDGWNVRWLPCECLWINYFKEIFPWPSSANSPTTFGWA